MARRFRQGKSRRPFGHWAIVARLAAIKLHFGSCSYAAFPLGAFFSLALQEAGLDIPWFMVNGEGESMISASAPFRYHYTRQDMNYHNPNWLHKTVITMVANLTTSEGGSENQEFTVHIVSLDTWALFGGPPFCEPGSATHIYLVDLCFVSCCAHE